MWHRLNLIWYLDIYYNWNILLYPITKVIVKISPDTPRQPALHDAFLVYATIKTFICLISITMVFIGVWWILQISAQRWPWRELFCLVDEYAASDWEAVKWPSAVMCNSGQSDGFVRVWRLSRHHILYPRKHKYCGSISLVLDWSWGEEISQHIF